MSAINVSIFNVMVALLAIVV